MRRELWTTGKVICFHEIYGSRADYARALYAQQQVCTSSPNDTGRKYLKPRQPVPTNESRSLSPQFLPTGDYRVPIPCRHRAHASCPYRSRNYGRNNINEAAPLFRFHDFMEINSHRKVNRRVGELRARRVY